jgi:hypothetical protein
VHSLAKNTGSPRLSKLALAALALSPLLILGSALVVLDYLTTDWQPGWDGLRQLITLIIAGQIAAYGGSLAAVVSIVLALMAKRKIRMMPETLRGLPQVRLAFIISIASLIGVWCAIGGFVAAKHIREAPQRAAAAEILGVRHAAAAYAERNGVFPDTLGDVVSPKIAARYVYLGKGLPSRYAAYQTPTSGSIVLMHSKEAIRGQYTAVSASGISRSWEASVLQIALRESAELRGGE